MFYFLVARSVKKILMNICRQNLITLENTLRKEQEEGIDLTEEIESSHINQYFEKCGEDMEAVLRASPGNAYARYEAAIDKPDLVGLKKDDIVGHAGDMYAFVFFAITGKKASRKSCRKIEKAHAEMIFSVIGKFPNTFGATYTPPKKKIERKILKGYAVILTIVVAILGYQQYRYKIYIEPMARFFAEEWFATDEVLKKNEYIKDKRLNPSEIRTDSETQENITSSLFEIERHSETMERILSSYQKEIQDNQETHDKINKQSERMNYLLHELFFYETRAAIVTENGTKYHKHSCPHLKNRDYHFWIYNVEQAKERGYTACADCW